MNYVQIYIFCQTSEPNVSFLYLDFFLISQCEAFNHIVHIKRTNPHLQAYRHFESRYYWWLWNYMGVTWALGGLRSLWVDRLFNSMLRLTTKKLSAVRAEVLGFQRKGLEMQECYRSHNVIIKKETDMAWPSEDHLTTQQYIYTNASWYLPRMIWCICEAV